MGVFLWQCQLLVDRRRLLWWRLSQLLRCSFCGICGNELEGLALIARGHKSLFPLWAALQKDLCHMHRPRLLLLLSLTPWLASADPCLYRNPPKHLRQAWLSLLWGHRSFPLGPGAHTVVFVPSKGRCFPNSYESSIIKSRCPSKLDSLGIPRPLAGSPGQEVWCWAWSLCSSVRTSLVLLFSSCGSPTQRVWNLILMQLFPSCHLFVASALCLDMGDLFFGRFHHLPVDGCSAASWNFGVLTGEHEHKSFYSTILDLRLIGVLYLGLAIGHEFVINYLIPCPTVYSSIKWSHYYVLYRVVARIK